MRLPIKTRAAVAGLALMTIPLAGCAGSVASGPIPTPVLSSPAPLGILTATGRVVVPGTEDPPIGATVAATTGVLPTAGATVTRPNTPVASITPATPCNSQACASAAAHFWLDRPIPSGSGLIDFVERSYPYGHTQSGQREPHHGVEFANGTGTPIVAAASGEVVVAGPDDTVAYGPATHFYGNLVVIRLDEALGELPVFNLYGHMRGIEVKAGEHVRAGQKLGTVGSTGVAIGPHLHFEVRVGGNDYTATRNPELWLKPRAPDGKTGGVIAGRVVDLDGNLLHEVTVVIRPLRTDIDRPRNRYVLTYAADPYFINGDDQLQENFAIGDLPAGLYSVSVSTTKFYQQTVTVVPNQTGWVTFVVNYPAGFSNVTPQPTDTAEPPATSEGATEEATVEATAEATAEATVEPTAEPTAEAATATPNSP
jgi:murein DD-endopeptidase MepM/ murein hydrolase activator NlpD